MFGKKPKPRRDLPAIDITKKPVKGVFGRTKMVPTTKKEQRQMKAALIQHNAFIIHILVIKKCLRIFILSIGTRFSLLFEHFS